MKTNYYIIVENVKNPIIKKLEILNGNNGYVIFKQSSLLKIIGSRLFKQLLKNGLYMTPKNNRNNDAFISIQRLIGCLYSDITGMEMHHINKDKTNNTFVNLVPLESDVNTSIDSLSISEMLDFGKQKHQEWVQKINKRKRDTLANNALLIIDILSGSINKTTKAVHKIFKSKIKSIKVIRKILNTYFYAEEFLKYLKSNKINIYNN